MILITKKINDCHFCDGHGKVAESANSGIAKCCPVCKGKKSKK